MTVMETYYIYFDEEKQKPFTSLVYKAVRLMERKPSQAAITSMNHAYRKKITCREVIIQIKGDDNE